MFPFSRSGRKWRQGEKGVSEAFTAIVILPIIVASIFVLVEIGFYMRYRMVVDDIVHDTVRSVAADGTAGVPPRWSNLYPATGAPTKQWWSVGQERLRGLCGSAPQYRRCESVSAARMRCTPTTLSVSPGVIVRCTATFPYKNILQFTVNNRTFNLGFGGFWTDDIVFTAQTRTMVGSGA